MNWWTLHFSAKLCILDRRTFLNQEKCVFINFHVCLRTNKFYVKLQWSSNEKKRSSFVSFVRIFRMYGGALPYGVKYVYQWKWKWHWNYLNKDSVAEWKRSCVRTFSSLTLLHTEYRLFKTGSGTVSRYLLKRYLLFVFYIK